MTTSYYDGMISVDLSGLPDFWLRYEDQSHRITERRVRPLRLRHASTGDALVAHCHERGAVRSFLMNSVRDFRIGSAQGQKVDLYRLFGRLQGDVSPDDRLSWSRVLLEQNDRPLAATALPQRRDTLRESVARIAEVLRPAVDRLIEVSDKQIYACMFTAHQDGDETRILFDDHEWAAKLRDDDTGHAKMEFSILRGRAKTVFHNTLQEPDLSPLRENPRKAFHLAIMFAAFTHQGFYSTLHLKRQNNWLDLESDMLGDMKKNLVETHAPIGA